MAIVLGKEFECRFPRLAKGIDHTGVLGLVVTSSGLDLSPVQARADGTSLYACSHAHTDKHG